LLATAIYEVAESFWSVAPASIIGGGFPRSHLRLKFSDAPCRFVEDFLLIGAWVIIQEADKVRVGHFVIHNVIALVLRGKNSLFCGIMQGFIVSEFV